MFDLVSCKPEFDVFVSLLQSTEVLGQQLCVLDKVIAFLLEAVVIRNNQETAYFLGRSDGVDVHVRVDDDQFLRDLARSVPNEAVYVRVQV
jgi:hypothetical protein